MRKCNICSQEKEESEFYSKGKSGRLNSSCKSCFNSYCIERWKQIKIDTVILFGNKCLDCQQTYHPNVFEFHHLDPNEKDYNWSKLRLFSPKRRAMELSKCVMLCANCHRQRHIE